jgi:fumarate hydratase subunit alpha
VEFINNVNSGMELGVLREISVSEIEHIVKALLIDSACKLPNDYIDALHSALENETSALGRQCISLLLENARYAESEGIPTCQDTGMVILDMQVGQDIHFIGGDVTQALDSAVRQAYSSMRKSVVNDPLLRMNTGDNTPAIVHYEIVPGEQVHITILMKGFGAELMSALRMFPPSAGIKGITQFVMETVEQAGPNACPPVIVGVGLGGSFDSVAYLAKKALMRSFGCPNPQHHLAKLEHDLLDKINMLGIGPQGFGGHFTALEVRVESYPTHIAALPVAVNLNCSAPRRAVVVI